MVPQWADTEKHFERFAQHRVTWHHVVSFRRAIKRVWTCRSYLFQALGDCLANECIDFIYNITAEMGWAWVNSKQKEIQIQLSDGRRFINTLHYSLNDFQKSCANKVGKRSVPSAQHSSEKIQYQVFQRRSFLFIYSILQTKHNAFSWNLFLNIPAGSQPIVVLSELYCAL